ncbi:hypothetical protein GCM10023081_27190 [Arthrobacter ginkgonis]|uniref:CHAT domain-containing protein n=2 Tax=Arthrobacter ginkgonis TaxID=1630594 RepID=A0ABP7CDR4_9MICC
MVRVIQARAGGEPWAAFRLDVDEMLDRRADLEQTILASAVSARRMVPLAEEPVRQAGQQLFDALFAGPVRGAYRASLGAAQQAGDQLRVVLRLAAPELAALPWEMLFDPETESYLCRNEPMLRRIPAPDYTPRALRVVPPLRILGVVSSPRGLPALDVDAEKERLETALDGPIAAGLVEVVWAPEATWAGVHEQLLAGPWHVVHFIGHGDYDVRAGEGLIALTDAHGRAAMVEASRLAYLLSAARPVPRLVVLNSCSSGESGTEELFSGTAAALVRSGVSAVAAMQFTVSDEAAIAFAQGFYTAIANGRRIDEAARNGRISITGNSRSTLEWVTPVLYVRGSETSLFTLTPPRGAARLRTDPLHTREPERPESSGEPERQPEGAAPEIRATEGPAADAKMSDERVAEARATEAARQEKQRIRWQDLYDRAGAALQVNQYGTAIELLDSLLAEEPGFRDAAALRETAGHRQQLASVYRRAQAAESAGDWVTAIRGYTLAQADPAFADAGTARRRCETRQRVAELQVGMRKHAEAGNWDVVLEFSAALAAVDRNAANPGGLATRARLELLYEQGRLAEEAGDRAAAGQLYAEILKTAPAFRDAEARRDACRETRNEARPQIPPPAVGGGPVRPVPTPQRVPEAGTELLRVRHGSAVNAVAFSPDGARLATGSWDKTARIWDAGTGAELLRLRHNTVVNTVAFSPDGARLATGSWGSSARIWDAGTGIVLLRIRLNSAVNAVAFSPDGTRLATGSDDINIWDVQSGAHLLHIRQENPVHAVAFSPDGTRLAGGSEDTRIWDARSGAQLVRIRHDLAATGAAFSRDGSRLVTGSNDRTAWIWEAATGRKLAKIRHDDAVWAVALSPAGTILATGCSDGAVRLWDSAGEDLRLQVHHDGGVSGLCFRPDGRALATASRDATARIWYIGGAQRRK